MPQLTDLNVVPYYDDFDQEDLFHRVLFRPGYAVQARELTQLQSILQNQVEEMGRNIFKEGAIISGGEVGMDKQYYAVKIQGTFNTTDITSNISSYKDKIVTGATSGVAGTVVGTAAASGDDPITLFVKYLNHISETTDGLIKDSDGIDKAFEMIIDYKALNGRTTDYWQAQQILDNPDILNDIAERSAIAMNKRVVPASFRVPNGANPLLRNCIPV